MALSPTLNFLLPCGGAEYTALSPQPFPWFFSRFPLGPRSLLLSSHPFLGSLFCSLGSGVRKEGKTSLNTLLFPPSRGKLGMAGYLSAASSGGCLPWRHQPADSGDWIPSGHPAVIKSERQQAAELHSAQLGMAPDLGCSCRGTSDACPACFSSRGCHLTMSHELVVTPAIP